MVTNSTISDRIEQVGNGTGDDAISNVSCVKAHDVISKSSTDKQLNEEIKQILLSMWK